MTIHALGGYPGGRQFQEESPRRKDASKCQGDQEWQARPANEDRVRFLRSMAVAPLNGQVMDTRGRGQIAAGDPASAGEHSVLAAVWPSAADSVPEKVLASPVDHMMGQKGACLKPDLTSNVSLGCLREKQLKTDLHFSRT